MPVAGFWAPQLARSPSAPPPKQQAPLAGAAAPAAAATSAAASPAPPTSGRAPAAGQPAPHRRSSSRGAAPPPPPPQTRLLRSPSAPPAPALTTLRPSFVAAQAGGSSRNGPASGRAACKSRNHGHRSGGADAGGQSPLPEVGASRGYKVVKCVGKGSFGRALLVEGSGGAQYVLKAVDLTRTSASGRQQQTLIQEARREAKVMAALKHPYVIRYREHFEEGGTLAMVMDFAPGGNLMQRITSARLAGSAFSEANVLRLFTQAVVGFKYVHGLGVIHRDVKSENFLLSAHDDILIADFGLAMHIGKNASFYDNKAVGTPYYLCPEIIERGRYSGASDMWALGVSLYELAALRVPFDANNLAGLTVKITQGTIPKLPDTYSSGLQLLSFDLLCRNYSLRPTAAELVKHPLVHGTIQRLVAEARGSATCESIPAAGKVSEPPPAREELPAGWAAAPPSIAHMERAGAWTAREKIDEPYAPTQALDLQAPEGPKVPKVLDVSPAFGAAGGGAPTAFPDSSKPQPGDERLPESPRKKVSPSAKSKSARRKPLAGDAAEPLELPQPSCDPRKSTAAPLAPRGPRPYSLAPLAKVHVVPSSGRQPEAAPGPPGAIVPLRGVTLRPLPPTAGAVSSAREQQSRCLLRSKSSSQVAASARASPSTPQAAGRAGGDGSDGVQRSASAEPMAKAQAAQAHGEEAGSPGADQPQVRCCAKPLSDAPSTTRERGPPSDGPLRLVGASHIASARRVQRC